MVKAGDAVIYVDLTGTSHDAKVDSLHFDGPEGQTVTLTLEGGGTVVDVPELSPATRVNYWTPKAPEPTPEPEPTHEP